MPLRIPTPLFLALVLLAACGEREDGDAGYVPPVSSDTATVAQTNQGDDAPPPDASITIDQVRTWYGATARIEELKKSDPTFADAILAVREQVDVDRMAATIEGIPLARSAIVEAGLTPASYLEVGFALYRARAVDRAINEGALEGVPAYPSRANVELVREHREEIDRLHAEVTAG